MSETKSLTMDEVLNFIDNMKVLELVDFVKKIEDRYGVSAAAPVAAAAATAGGGGGAAVAEEKTSFDAILTSVGDKKIQVIKVVRELTGLGLKEAKDLVEAGDKPLKENVSKEEAAKVKKQIEDAGGAVEVK